MATPPSPPENRIVKEPLHPAMVILMVAAVMCLTIAITIATIAITIAGACAK